MPDGPLSSVMIQTLEGALESLERSVDQCGTLTLGDLITTTRLLKDAQHQVGHEIFAHRIVSGEAVTKLIEMKETLDSLPNRWLLHCKCERK